MAAQHNFVLSNSGKVCVPLTVATACAHITKRIEIYDPYGVVGSVVCVGTKVPLPLDVVKIWYGGVFDRGMLEIWGCIMSLDSAMEGMKISDGGESGAQNLWARMMSLDADYKQEIPMELLREGEFRVRRNTTTDIGKMVANTDVLVKDAAVPTHITQARDFIRAFANFKLGGVVVVSGCIYMMDERHPLDPTSPSYKCVWLKEVVKGKPLFAVVESMEDHFFCRGGRVWIFEE